MSFFTIFGWSERWSIWWLAGGTYMALPLPELIELCFEKLGSKAPENPTHSVLCNNLFIVFYHFCKSRDFLNKHTVSCKIIQIIYLASTFRIRDGEKCSSLNCGGHTDQNTTFRIFWYIELAVCFFKCLGCILLQPRSTAVMRSAPSTSTPAAFPNWGRAHCHLL